VLSCRQLVVGPANAHDSGFELVVDRRISLSELLNLETTVHVHPVERACKTDGQRSEQVKRARLRDAAAIRDFRDSEVKMPLAGDGAPG
jgi:hypothetical protein